MSTREGLVLDGLDLNDGTVLTVVGMDFKPAKKKLDLIGGVDTDGALPLEAPKADVLLWSITLRAPTAATADLALQRMGSVTLKLDEADQQVSGLPLVWTPRNTTQPATTWYVLSGEVVEIPMSQGHTDWLAASPVWTITLTCKPFGYGAEYSVATVTSSAPLVTLDLPTVKGDVAAEARLIVTDMATQARRHVEWGLEQRFYTPLAPASLLIDSDSLVTSGTGGVQTTRTGAYDPNATGNNVIRGTLTPQVAAVAATGALAHVGSFRVKCRVYASTTDVRARLSWRVGDGAFVANAYATPPVAANFAEIDLGVITIPAALLGTQSWDGFIEAYSPTTGDTIDVDVLELIPTKEGYGRAVAPTTTQASVVTGHDEFTATAAGGALDTRVAPAGGTWATTGATTDFVFSDGDGTNTFEAVTRSGGGSTSDRHGTLGATSFTDVDVGATIRVAGNTIRAGLVARWVDASNFLSCYLRRNQFDSGGAFTLVKVVAGVETVLGTVAINVATLTPYKMRIVCYASGQVIATLVDSGGAEIASLSASDAVLATAGALQTGKPGIADRASASTAFARYYDDFYVATPPAEQVAINSTRSMEIRSDATQRESSAGGVWGSPVYRGTRFELPAAGDKNRTARVAVKARRGNVEKVADDQIADSTKVEVRATPRYRLPRSAA